MSYREDEKRWKRIQEMLAAEASGQQVKPVVSQRTLFGIPSTVEQVIQRTVEEDEAARRAKRMTREIGADAGESASEGANCDASIGIDTNAGERENTDGGSERTHG